MSNAIDTILKHEGGYTNNPKDTGNYNYDKELVDMVVNHGYSNTVPIVQRAINTKVDGASGKGTRKAIQDALKNPNSLQIELVKNRASFYNDIVKRDPSQSEFLKGWLSRAYSFLPT